MGARPYGLRVAIFDDYARCNDVYKICDADVALSVTDTSLFDDESEQLAHVDPTPNPACQVL
jgi:hypothetical protein